VQPTDDPGWALAAPKAPVTFLRLILLSYTFGAVAFGVVLLLLDLDEVGAGISTALAILVVAAAGLVGVVGGAAIRGLDGSSEAALAQSYRARFFLRLVLAEAPALLGFLRSFVAGTPLVYAMAVPFLIIGFVRAAPTRASIQRDQDALAAAGAPASLFEVLY
jgi:hypothetical protein